MNDQTPGLGCHNVNFVTPRTMSRKLSPLFLKPLGMGLRIPSRLNCSGYESLESFISSKGSGYLHAATRNSWPETYAKEYCNARITLYSEKKVLRRCIVRSAISDGLFMECEKGLSFDTLSCQEGSPPPKLFSVHCRGNFSHTYVEYHGSISTEYHACEHVPINRWVRTRNMWRPHRLLNVFNSTGDSDILIMDSVETT